MATINDYKAWLQEVDIGPSDYESPSALVNAIRHVGEYGLFKVVEANGTNNGIIISADGTEDKLHLVTDKQINAFITHIEASLCNGMSAEAYESFKRGMGKDD